MRRAAAIGRRGRFGLLAIISFAALAQGCSRDPVVIKVGERRIHKSRLETDYLRVAAEDTTLRGEAGLKSFLDDYINKNVLELMAREKYPTLTPDQLERQRNTERTVLRDAIRRRRMADRIRPVTEQEALAFHKLRGKGYVARHIMVAARPAAEEILAEIRKGADFAALAAARSADTTTAKRGGVLRFSPGVFFPEFEDSVIAMKPGDTGIVETPLGFHVVRLDSVVARSDTVSFESERKRIEDLLRARQVRKLRAALLDSLMTAYKARLDEDAVSWFDTKVVATGGSRPIPSLTPEEKQRVLATFEGGQVTAADYVDCLHERGLGQLPMGGDLRVQRDSAKDCLFNMLCAMEGKRLGLDKEPDIADILRDREEQLRVTRLYLESVETAVDLTDDDYHAFYEKHRDDFVDPEQWRVQVIGVRDSVLASALVAEWSGGAEFSKVVARGHAQDSLGVASQEDGLQIYDVPDVAPWVNAIRGRDIGAVAGPAYMQSLYYAVRLKEHTPARPKSYEQAFDGVAHGAAAERKEARMQQLLADGKKKFPVSVDEKALKRVKLAAPSGKSS